MNRLESARRSLETHHRSARGSFLDRPPVQLSFAHRVFTPEHYEPRYAYPLLVWLHSDRSSEYEIDTVMPQLSLRNYVAVGLRGTQRAVRGRKLFRWSLSSSSLALAEESLFEAVDQISESLSIHPQRIFVGGMGQGGTLAQLLGLRYPDRFAGAISINGAFPSSPRALLRWKEAKKLPILWMHGIESESCGLEEMCRMLESAYPAALQVYPVQFPCGDELDTQMLSKMNRFMMQIVTGAPISLQEAMV